MCLCILWMVVYQFSLVFPRLAKLLLQWDPNLCIRRRKNTSSRSTLSAPQQRCSSQYDKENYNPLKVLTCSHSLENISAKQGTYLKCFYLYICVCVLFMCAAWNLVMKAKDSSVVFLLLVQGLWRCTTLHICPLARRNMPIQNAVNHPDVSPLVLSQRTHVPFPLCPPPVLPHLTLNLRKHRNSRAQK